jgi:rod shape-determining protein MreC
VYRKQVRRRRAVLALLIVSSFALLTATYGDQSGALQRGLGTVFSPLQEGADRALKPARDLVNWFDETFDARGENDRLRAEVADLRENDVEEKVAQSDYQQLQKLFGLDVPGGYERVGARVIAKSPTVWYSSVTIDEGSSSGVRVDDSVMSPDGLAGRVTAVGPSWAKVTLITDPNSAVSAKVVPEGIQGVIQPEVGDPSALVLDFIDSSEIVRSGETVVTAGWRNGELSSLFPYGLAIGTVTRATIAEQEASQQVHVRLYADLKDLDLVEVLVRPGDDR